MIPPEVVLILASSTVFANASKDNNFGLDDMEEGNV